MGSGAGEREEHAGGDIQGSVGSGESGREHNEIHQVTGSRQVHRAEDSDKRTLGDSGAIPGHDAHQNGDGTKVEEGQRQKRHANRTGNFRDRARLAGGHSDEFDSAKSVNREGEGEQGSSGAGGEEAALGGVLGRGAADKQQGGTEDDERRDEATLIVANQNSKRP